MAAQFRQYLQVLAEDVYNAPEFVSVARAPANMVMVPKTVGFVRRFTVYDMSDKDIADAEVEWLAQENEQLRDEVEELTMDLERAHSLVQWLEADAIAAGEGPIDV